jgi:YgiT-type zinc finger domain-containing protein
MDYDGNLAENEQIGIVNSCSRCSAGVMHLRHITYFTWLNEELITVPNFPAWVCDICGRRKLDPRAVAWLNMLLNPSGKREARSRSRFIDEVPRSDGMQS